jgi:hypothetical protein
MTSVVTARNGVWQNNLHGAETVAPVVTSTAQEGTREGASVTTLYAIGIDEFRDKEMQLLVLLARRRKGELVDIQL